MLTDPSAPRVADRNYVIVFKYCRPNDKQATLRELEMKGGTVAAHQLLNLVS
jgi:hypothetical protein